MPLLFPWQPYSESSPRCSSWRPGLAIYISMEGVSCSRWRRQSGWPCWLWETWSHGNTLVLARTQRRGHCDGRHEGNVAPEIRRLHREEERRSIYQRAERLEVTALQASPQLCLVPRRRSIKLASTEVLFTSRKMYRIQWSLKMFGYSFSSHRLADAWVTTGKSISTMQLKRICKPYCKSMIKPSPLPTTKSSNVWSISRLVWASASAWITSFFLVGIASSVKAAGFQMMSLMSATANSAMQRVSLILPLANRQQENSTDPIVYCRNWIPVQLGWGGSNHLHSSQQDPCQYSWLDLIVLLNDHRFQKSSNLHLINLVWSIHWYVAWCSWGWPHGKRPYRS